MGDGEVLGVVLVVFGFGGGAGCVVVVRGAKSLVAAAWFILKSICSYPLASQMLIDKLLTELRLQLPTQICVLFCATTLQ